jgi:hypothetical protein
MRPKIADAFVNGGEDLGEQCASQGQLWGGQFLNGFRYQNKQQNPLFGSRLEQPLVLLVIVQAGAYPLVGCRQLRLF